MHVGFVGTGNMGAPMAANILKAGHTMTVHDARPEATAELERLGATRAPDLPSLARAARVTLLSLPNDTIVDAVVFVKEKIIPIDSKFSLENYNKMVEERDGTEKKKLETIFVNDLKNRITETAKYIQPARGTTDFAFMFIPHEAIYYDLLTNKVGSSEENAENLIQRAAGKYKVIITSPTSFLAYLQTVLQGLKALQIEESAKEIIKKVEDLGKHLKSYDEYHNKLGNSISTVVNHYNSSNKELKKIDKDVLRIAGSSPELALLEVEKPKLEE